MAFSRIAVCGSCGTKNRIPARHLADTGRCGSCKAALDPVAEPVEVDATAFDEIISATEVPVLVDFWAAWCGPCRTAAPEVAGVARDLAGRALVLKVDTEAHQELAARYQIRSIPNFIVFRGGRAAFQQAGLASRAEMRRWVTSEA